MRFSYFQVNAPWSVIARRALCKVDEDNCLGLAAELAFYFLLALFPALLFLVALVGYLPVENAVEDLIRTLGAVAPREIVLLVREQLNEITGGNDAGILTLGAVGALWSSSAAMVAIIGALNRVYKVAEWRPWWKRRIVAIVLTALLAVLVFVALLLMFIGPALASRIALWFGYDPAVVLVWQISRLPVMVLCVMLGVELVYHFAPNRRGSRTWITPGSLVATMLWLCSSWVFTLYVGKVADYSATYGTIGGVIVTMLWFYVCSLAVLIGAEVNGVIEEMKRLVPEA